MTPADFRTRREACGLSIQDAAEFLDVSLRTISHWETGRNAVAPGAAAELLELDSRIEGAVSNFLALAADLAAKHGKPDAIDLTRYRTAEDYAGSRAAADGLPHPCHNALLARVMVALQRAGYKVAISYAAPPGLRDR